MKTLDSARPIDLLADLDIEIGGENVHVRGEGAVVIVDLPTLQAGRRLLRNRLLRGRGRRQSTRRLQQALEAGGVVVEVRLRGEPLARLGHGVEPGALSRLFGLGDARVKLRRSLRVLAADRPVLAGALIGAVALLIAGVVYRLLRR